jgi:hypothetical protein
MQALSARTPASGGGDGSSRWLCSVPVAELASYRMRSAGCRLLAPPLRAGKTVVDVQAAQTGGAAQPRPGQSPPSEFDPRTVPDLLDPTRTFHQPLRFSSARYETVVAYSDSLVAHVSHRGDPLRKSQHR